MHVRLVRCARVPACRACPRGAPASAPGLARMPRPPTPTPRHTLLQLKRIARAIYSNPPVHGARVVAEVVGNEEMFDLWRGEMDAMAGRIKVGWRMRARAWPPCVPTLVHPPTHPSTRARAHAPIHPPTPTHPTPHTRPLSPTHIPPAAGCAPGAVQRAGGAEPRQGLGFCALPDWHVLLHRDDPRPVRQHDQQGGCSRTGVCGCCWVPARCDNMTNKVCGTQRGVVEQVTGWLERVEWAQSGRVGVRPRFPARTFAPRTRPTRPPRSRCSTTST